MHAPDDVIYILHMWTRVASSTTLNCANHSSSVTLRRQTIAFTDRWLITLHGENKARKRHLLLQARLLTTTHKIQGNGRIPVGSTNCTVLAKGIAALTRA